jgi:N-acetylglutamate synthase-like GNAT family acetyltransferase
MSSIRKATTADLPFLKELIMQLGSLGVTDQVIINRIQMIEENPLDFMFVYEESNIISAAIVLRIRENIREVSRYLEVVIAVVLDKSRRKGIGRRLMEFAEKKAMDEGCKAMYLISGFQRENEAHQFYKEIGYIITGYRFVKELT